MTTTMAYTYTDEEDEERGRRVRSQLDALLADAGDAMRRGASGVTAPPPADEPVPAASLEAPIQEPAVAEEDDATPEDDPTPAPRAVAASSPRAPTPPRPPRQSAATPRPKEDPRLTRLLSSVMGEQVRPYDPEAAIADAQRKDRRREIVGRLLQAAGVVGGTIGAARGKPWAFPIASLAGRGAASVLGATADHTQRAVGEAQREQQRREAQAKQAADLAKARREEQRLALDERRVDIEGRAADANVARTQAETAPWVVDSPVSRAEQRAVAQTLSELGVEVTPDLQAQIDSMPAASLQDPRSPVAQLFARAAEGREEGARTRLEELRFTNAQTLQAQRDVAAKERAQITAAGLARRNQDRSGGTGLDPTLIPYLQKYGAERRAVERQLSAARDLQDFVSLFPDGDLPGVGWSEFALGMLPEEVRGEDVQRMHAKVREVTNSILRSESGAAIQVQEEVQRLQTLLLNPRTPPNLFREGVDRLAQIAQETEAYIDASYPPEVVDYHRGRRAQMARPEPRSRPPEGGARESGGAPRRGWVYDPQTGAEQPVRDVDEALRRMPRLREGRAP